MAEFSTTVRVIYGDTDAMGVVYNGNYLRYFEKARADLMREAGCPYAEVEKAGYHFPVMEAMVRYHNPARYDELLRIETAMAWVKRASMRIDYAIYGPEEQGSPLIATGHTIHASINRQGKVVGLPGEVRERIRRFLREPSDS